MGIMQPSYFLSVVPPFQIDIVIIDKKLKLNQLIEKIKYFPVIVNVF